MSREDGLWTSERPADGEPAHPVVPLEVRRTNASDQAPATASAPAHRQSRSLTSPEWQTVTVPVGATAGSWLRKMHRVDIDVSPVFIPAEADSANPDRRHLGVQVRWLGAK
jgi:hypothetical protein